MMIPVFILWCMYACLEGAREGFMFHNINVDNKLGRILHTEFAVQRLTILVIVISLSFDWWVISLPLVFSFFHNGSYYTVRNYLNKDIYKERWFAQSATSTAITTKIFTPVVRTILAIAGTAILILAKIYE